MAELSKADLGKRGNEDTMVKKFLHMGGLMDTFLHKNGQFKPHAMVLVIDGEEHPFENDEDDRYDELIARVRSILERKNNRDKILFVGRFVNTNQVKTVPITEMVKTEEFGGQTGGKKINLGIKFENDFYESLRCELACECKPTPYKKEAQSLIEQIGKDVKVGYSDVEAVGGKNQPRPLAGGSGGLYVTAQNKKTKDIGGTVTDITTYWGANKQPVYLSLKYGNTLTFINSGVGRIFTADDYKKSFAGYSNPIGNQIFKMFGIDPITYAKVFNDYPHKTKMPTVDVTNKCDKGAIEDLLQYAMGYGYWMVHGGTSGGVKMYEMDQAYMKRASQITGSVKLMYGGSQGKGKRLDIHMESSVYKFMFNLRNKQSGLYPSHIMCDYKKK
tara:strand:+ start:856 stop:2016 length:1161 start_codon:yes stop_codon:yes gene_type:complete